MMDNHFNEVGTVTLFQGSHECMKIVPKLEHVELTHISHRLNIREVFENSSGIFSKNDWPPLLATENHHRDNSDNSMENQLPTLACETLNTAFILITVLLLRKHTATNSSEDGVDKEP